MNVHDKIKSFLFKSEQCCDINNYNVINRIWQHLLHFLSPKTFQGVRLLLHSYNYYSTTTTRSY